MTTNLKKRLACGVAAVVLAVGGWWHGGAMGQTPQTPAVPSQQIIAEVNGVPITRQDLADELIARFGSKQLEKLINRRIIEQECAKRGITVTELEVEAALREKMQVAGVVSVADFERQLLKPRQMTMPEYRNDVLRPSLLMQRLAGSRIQVTEEDLRKAFSSRYGEKVQCRAIVEKNQNDAMRKHGQIAGNREKFIELARQQPDRYLSSVAGMLLPIGRNTTHDIVERRAFEMKDGEVSEVIQTPEGGYLILYREKLIPADTTKKFEAEREKLARELAEEKAQKEVPALFTEMKKQAKVRDYLNDRWNLQEYIEDKMKK